MVLLVENEVKNSFLSARLCANDSVLPLHFCFWLGPTTVFTIQPKTQKRAYPYIYGSHGTIHIFKNYFAIVFSIINF